MHPSDDGTPPPPPPGPPAAETAAAWRALLASPGPATGDLPPAVLARALLHAAREGRCREAAEDEDRGGRYGLAATRAWCHLRLALRRETSDPGGPDERRVWAALRAALPAPWWEALEEDASAVAGALRAARRARPWLLPSPANDDEEGRGRGR